MADNFEQGQEVIIGNRRMRKIKRPKPQNAPISTPPYQNTPEAQNTPAPYQTPGINKDSLQNDEISASAIPPYIEDEAYTYENEQPALVYNGWDNKRVLIVAAVCILLGILFGKFVFGAPKVVQQGLQGVVLNAEVPKGRSRCGMVEKTQGCVLYIMNPQRQEMNGRDFFDLAAQQTGRQRFVIETGNMRYSSVKIKPGSIAQLNIPPL